MDEKNGRYEGDWVGAKGSGEKDGTKTSEIKARRSGGEVEEVRESCDHELRGMAARVKRDEK